MPGTQGVVVGDGAAVECVLELAQARVEGDGLDAQAVELSRCVRGVVRCGAGGVKVESAEKAVVAGGTCFVASSQKRSKTSCDICLPFCPSRRRRTKTIQTCRHSK